MADITITKTAEDAASKALRVTVPPDRVQAAEHRAVQEYGRRARLPGFRHGKAPEAVVRKRFGPAIRQWVIEELIREGWQQAKVSEELKPIADPAVRNLKFEDGGPVEFEFLVEVRPTISLARVGGFTVTRQVPVVTDEMVREQLERMREDRATWTPVDGQKPAPGQLVRVDVQALEEGSGGEAQPYSIVLGQGQAVPSLEERIMELVPGGSADTEIRFPDDHPDAEKRGVARRVRITLHEVKRQELPPLDDGFAKEIGDFNDLAALEAAVRSDLAKAAEREVDARVREQLLQQVIDANGVEAPPSLVQRALHAYLHAYQIPPEREELFDHEFRPIAVGQVKRELVIGALAEAHGLHATEAEVDARVAAIARSRQRPPAEVYASLEKAKRLPELERGITEDKVFQFLVSQSTIEENGP
jgi:trigger factor